MADLFFLESLYHLVMRCVTAVAVSNQGQSEDGLTSKSVKWVKVF